MRKEGRKKERKKEEKEEEKKREKKVYKHYLLLAIIQISSQFVARATPNIILPLNTIKMEWC